MNFSLISSLLMAQAANGFTTASRPATASFLKESEISETAENEAVPELENSPFSPSFVPEVQAVNGWTPDDSKPCFGLPGVVAPTGYFDPIGFCQTGISLNDVKRYREAEVQHGRVAMLAAVGYFAGEAIQGPFSISGPANDQLAQVPLPAFLFLSGAIAAAELKRATIGWVEPTKFKSLWALRENYYPGDLGFDPLGLKPEDPEKFENMQTKELQNGRLAMIGVAGMISQELVNHKTILDTIDFYQKVYSGINPYE
jgi:hypothetical protein